MPGDTLMAEKFNPTPSVQPIVPPMLHSSFEPHERFYRAKAGRSGGVVSANPQLLRAFSQQIYSLNLKLEEDLSWLRNAWSQFCNECSWVPVG